MSEKPKKKNVFKIAIIVLLSLIVVGGAAFGGMYIAGKKGATTTTKKTVAPVVTDTTYSLDECLINLADTDSKRYLKVLVYVGYGANADLATELETQKPIIRDIVISTLREKTTADFNNDAGVDAIKKQLIARINPVLTKGKIDHIYFNDLLVQ